MHENFKVKCQLKEKSLFANIVSNENFNKFTFYLLKDGIVYKKYTNIESNSIIVELKETGVYSVQGYIKPNIFKNSNSIFYCEQKIIDSYNQELKLAKSVENNFHLIYKENLPLHNLIYPYKTFAILTNLAKEQKDALRNYCASCNFVIEELIINTQIVTVLFEKGNSLLRDSSGNFFIFSGKCINKNIEGVVCGDIDIIRNNNFDINSFKNSAGNYVIAIFNSDYFEVCTDFFGLGKIFYYTDEKIGCISNSYHFELILLKLLSYKLTLNLDKIQCSLLAVKNQFFQQNFSHCMDVNNVYQKPVYKDIIFNDSIELVNNRMYSILENSEKKDPCSIDLLEVRDDIKNNIKHILEDQRFENIIFDLTGGLDSRVLFSVITQIDTNDKFKFKINSKRNCIKDYEIACNLNNLYHYIPGNFSVDSKNLLYKECDQIMRSYYMGTYYAYGIISTIKRSKCASITGALGEVNFRPYYGRYANRRSFYKDYNDKEYIDFLNTLFLSFSPNFIMDSEKLNPKLCNFIKDSSELFLNMHHFEKYDLMYLFFRNLYHFDPYFYDVFGIPSFAPLQSQKSFINLHNSMKNECNIFYQLDTIKEFNPLLLLENFEDDNDNNEFFQFMDNKNINIFNTFKRKNVFDLDVKNIDIECKFINSKSSKNSFIFNEDKELFNITLIILSELEKQKVISSKMLYAIYYFILNNKGRYLRNIYNILISVYEQMKICLE